MIVMSHDLYVLFYGTKMDGKSLNILKRENYLLLNLFKAVCVGERGCPITSARCETHRTTTR